MTRTRRDANVARARPRRRSVEPRATTDVDATRETARRRPPGPRTGPNRGPVERSAQAPGRRQGLQSLKELWHSLDDASCLWKRSTLR